MPTSAIVPRLVEFIPDQLEDGVLYISQRFRTCSHLCCCGCGEEVVTPLSAAEWSLTLEGSLASLWPSIGNWNYACRSHYVIRRNQVLWAKPMNARQVANVQRRDAVDLARSVEIANRRKRGTEQAPEGAIVEFNASATEAATTSSPSTLRRLVRWLLGG